VHPKGASPPLCTVPLTHRLLALSAPLTRTENMYATTGVFSAAFIDSIPGQHRFYELHDLGTGPLHGASVPSSGSTKEVEEWLEQA